jgi:hypothetical protein
VEGDPHRQRRLRRALEIEEALFGRRRDLFSQTLTLVFFDTTSIYFEGRAGGETIARRGRSKDHRSDLVQMVVGVVIDADGGNSIIDDGRELFGNRTPMPDGRCAENGFLALGAYDDNHDGLMDAADAVFDRLRIWRDTQRDGVVQAGELVPLSEFGVAEISLAYRQSQHMDRWGNLFRWRSVVRFVSGKHHFAWDVILRTAVGPGRAVTALTRQSAAPGGMPKAAR